MSITGSFIVIYLTWFVANFFREKQFKVCQYEDGKFYIKVNSLYIPFYYTSGLSVSYSGDLERDWRESLYFYSKSGCEDVLNEYIQNKEQVRKSNKLVKTYKVKLTEE